MKGCEYCNKEISYKEQYCCSECEEKAKQHYALIKEKQKLFSTFNIIGILAIFIGGFLAMMMTLNIGLFCIGGGFIILGILFILLPFCTPEQIKKYKIKKAVKIVKIFGLFILILGAGAVIAGFFF